MNHLCYTLEHCVNKSAILQLKIKNQRRGLLISRSREYSGIGGSLQIFLVACYVCLLLPPLCLYSLPAIIKANHNIKLNENLRKKKKFKFSTKDRIKKDCIRNRIKDFTNPNKDI